MKKCPICKREYTKSCHLGCPHTKHLRKAILGAIKRHDIPKLDEFDWEFICDILEDYYNGTNEI